MSLVPSILAIATVAGTMLALGCATGVADTARGERLYTRNCAACHDAQGGIGSRLTRQGLASYGTALGLYDYNRRFMPYGAEGTLPDPDTWDITAYVLVRSGFVEADAALTLAEAATVPLARPPE